MPRDGVCNGLKKTFNAGKNLIAQRNGKIKTKIVNGTLSMMSKILNMNPMILNMNIFGHQRTGKKILEEQLSLIKSSQKMF